MGICCSVDDFDEIEMDLPPPNLDKYADKYERFEMSLPFCRTKIQHFWKHVNEAEEACGGKGYVTAEALEEYFRTPAWNALRNQEGPLLKFLASPVFKDEKKVQQDTQMDVECLKTFGIIHCAGTPS